MIYLPPTPIEAHDAAHTVVYNIAAPFDSAFTIDGPCVRVGKRSRACAATVNGPLAMHLRVTVTRAGESLVIRARQT
jgi:hypothetical protein